MNSQEKKALNSCNKKDLIALINDPDYVANPANQFPAIIGYLARHGLPGGSTKEELMDLIYTARNELLAQSAKKHADSKEPFPYDNLGNLSKVNDARVKEFIRNPVGAVIREMETFNKRQEDFSQIQDPDEVQYYKNLKTNADTLAIELKASVKEKNKYEHNPATVDIVCRLTKKMPEKDADLSASLKRINSGFFGTLFRRPSKEYKAFQDSFNFFRDPNSAISGNVEDLEKKTKAYLEHVIPGFKYSKDMPKQQWLAQLPKGKKERAEFCMNVLESIEEHKQMKPIMDQVENAIAGKVVNNAQNPEPVKEEVNQKEFQQELANNIEAPVQKKEVVENSEDEPQIQSNDLQP